MKLPNAENAYIDLSKLRDYALNPNHKEGRHKAVSSNRPWGINIRDADWLYEQLLVAARTLDCQLGRRTAHGQRYIIDFTLTRARKAASLRSAWNIRPTENFPRLITCYVL